MSDPGEVRDLSAEAASAVDETKALANLKRNLSHLRISAIDHDGPEIDFGDGVILRFRPQIPATAMAELIGTDNRVEGLKSYIRFALMPASREEFDDLLDDIPLEALNAIVEVISEATTSFPT